MKTTTLYFYRRYSNSLSVNEKSITKIHLFNKDGVIVSGEQHNSLKDERTNVITTIEGETKHKRKLDFSVKHHFTYTDNQRTDLYLNIDLIEYEAEQNHLKYKCSEFSKYINMYKVNSSHTIINIWDDYKAKYIYPTIEERLRHLCKDTDITFDTALLIAHAAQIDKSFVEKIARVAEEYKEREKQEK